MQRTADRADPDRVRGSRRGRGSAAGQDAAPAQRLGDLAAALRGLGLANPQRYLLLYGTPVPGYSAPPEATALARRIFAPVLEAFTTAVGGARRKNQPGAFTRSVTF